MTHYFTFDFRGLELDMYCHVREKDGELVASEFGIEATNADADFHVDLRNRVNKLLVFLDLSIDYDVSDVDLALQLITTCYPDDLQEAALAGLNIDDFLTDEHEAAQERDWEADNGR